MRQLEHLVSRYIDSDILRGLGAAKRVGRWDTIDDKNLYYSALAAAADYYSVSCVDADFFFSLLYTIVNDTGSAAAKQGQAHVPSKLDEEVVQYCVLVCQLRYILVMCYCSIQLGTSVLVQKHLLTSRSMFM